MLGLHGFPLPIVGFIRILKTISVSVCGQVFWTKDGMTKCLTPPPSLHPSPYPTTDNC